MGGIGLNTGACLRHTEINRTLNRLLVTRDKGAVFNTAFDLNQSRCLTIAVNLSVPIQHGQGHLPLGRILAVKCLRSKVHREGIQAIVCTNGKLALNALGIDLLACRLALLIDTHLAIFSLKALLINSTNTTIKILALVQTRFHFFFNLDFLIYI